MSGSAVEALARSRRDPWNYSACIPDLAAGTGCFSVKQEYVFSTGAAGSSNCFAMSSNPTAIFYTDSGSTAATPTITGNWIKAAAISNISSLYGYIRPVSFGFKATYIGPTITDGGVLLLGSVNANIPVGSFNGQTVTNVQSSMLKYVMCPLRNGCTVTWEPEDIVDTANFVICTNTSVGVSSTPTSTPWLFLAVYGAASSQGTIMVDAAINFEGQFENQTFMPGGLQNEDKHAEPGWFEKTKDILRSVPTMAAGTRDLIEAAAQAAPALGYLANGLRAAGVLARTGLPRLTY